MIMLPVEYKILIVSSIVIIIIKRVLAMASTKSDSFSWVSWTSEPTTLYRKNILYIYTKCFKQKLIFVVDLYA